MYIDTQGMGKEEKDKMKRRIRMQQLSYDSDLKKVQRKQLEIKDDLKRYEQERNRIEIYIKETEQKNKKMIEKEDFITEELRRIKKQLIELG